MSRPIDADALWMDIIRRMDYCEDMLEIIKKQPTVEVERPRGKWIGREGKDDCLECSECHAVIESNEVYWRNNYYCYHCGADMRGDSNDTRIKRTLIR